MEENFRGLNVNLNELMQRVDHYMKKEGFDTNVDLSPEWLRLQAKKEDMFRTAVGAARCIEVHIRGDPNAFDVEMTTGDWGRNLAASAVVGALTLGVGWLTAGISAGMYKQLENKIFDYIHWQVDELKGTGAGTGQPTIAQPGMVRVTDLVSALPRCPKCQQRVRAEFRVCPFCSFDLTSMHLKCPSCASPVEPSWSVCANCGTTLTWSPTP